MKAQHDTVVVLDFGAINSQAAAKIIRNLSVYCEVLPCTAKAERISALNPKAIILQRGAACGEATINRAPACDPASFGVPVLDLMDKAPDAATIGAFLDAQPQIKRDWTTQRFIDETIADIREKVGSKRVLLAMSGGVDSSVCAMLLHKAIGDQLTCVFVDHGCMRKDEPKQVVDVFKGEFGVNLIAIDGEARFLAACKGVTDPEQKRKIIGETFIRVFEEEASKLGKIEFLAQGTIYPDIIESGWDGGKPVKSHHNVGGLPKDIGFEGLVEPIKYLFKDEVRAVGEAMGLPPHITRRQPFPGPGLGVRCLGELTKEKLDILREADARFRGALEREGFAKMANQYFAILTNVRSVGVKDDARTYGYVICLRAVQTVDFMTAKVVELPIDFLVRIGREIATEVAGVNRVCYDITSKPPATIEWE